MAAKIDKIARYGWKDGEGTKGKMKWILTSSLKVDPEIQRLVSDVSVMAIARNFDWAQFGTLDVSKRPDGNYYVFDGQHRLRAVQKRGGIQYLPCQIHDFDGDRRMEAMALVERNSNIRRMDAMSKHKLRVIAEESLACNVQEMLDSLGLVVSNGHGPNVVRCIALVYKTFLKNPESCKDALILQRELTGKDEQIQDRIHRAMFAFCEKYGAKLLETHIDRLRKAGGKIHLLQNINAVVALSGQREASTALCLAGLKTAINKGLRSGKIPMGE